MKKPPLTSLESPAKASEVRHRKSSETLRTAVPAGSQVRSKESWAQAKTHPTELVQFTSQSERMLMVRLARGECLWATSEEL